MKVLSPPEWQAWCEERQFPLRESGRPRPNPSAAGFQTLKLPYPQDSGRKVILARFLYTLITPIAEAESLILLDDWAVWPSCQHEPLFTRFRQALGEERHLIEAPGHLVQANESDDSVSIITTALLFIWDCYGISPGGRDAFFFSHDEYAYFASLDQATIERTRQSMSDYF